MSEAILLWGLLFGSVGLFYFMYGKRIAHPVMRYTGLVLMLFPYVVQNTIAMVVVGVVLILLPRFVKI